MINLLSETIEKLVKHGKKPEDVLFVMDTKSYCSFKEFSENASFEYDDGFGCIEISLHLKIVGADWWLERYEYDGSEGWEFKTLPIKPSNNCIPIIKND